MALYHSWKCLGAKGVFAGLLSGLPADRGEESPAIIDATRLQAHRTVTRQGEKSGLGRLIGRRKGGTNTRLRADCDGMGGTLDLIVTAGQIGDQIGSRAFLGRLPEVHWL
jgi:hypothetical protein